MKVNCPRDGMVDITDLKSVGLRPLPVQVRPRVPDPLASDYDRFYKGTHTKINRFF